MIARRGVGPIRMATAWGGAGGEVSRVRARPVGNKKGPPKKAGLSCPEGQCAEAKRPKNVRVRKSSGSQVFRTLVLQIIAKKMDACSVLESCTSSPVWGSMKMRPFSVRAMMMA